MVSHTTGLQGTDSWLESGSELFTVLPAWIIMIIQMENVCWIKELSRTFIDLNAGPMNVHILQVGRRHCETGILLFSISMALPWWTGNITHYFLIVCRVWTDQTKGYDLWSVASSPIRWLISPFAFSPATSRAGGPFNWRGGGDLIKLLFNETTSLSPVFFRGCLQDAGSLQLRRGNTAYSIVNKH